MWRVDRGWLIHEQVSGLLVQRIHRLAALPQCTRHHLLIFHHLLVVVVHEVGAQAAVHVRSSIVQRHGPNLFFLRIELSLLRAVIVVILTIKVDLVVRRLPRELFPVLDELFGLVSIVSCSLGDASADDMGFALSHL